MMASTVIIIFNTRNVVTKQFDTYHHRSKGTTLAAVNVKSLL